MTSWAIFAANLNFAIICKHAAKNGVCEVLDGSFMDQHARSALASLLLAIIIRNSSPVFKYSFKHFTCKNIRWDLESLNNQQPEENGWIGEAVTIARKQSAVWRPWNRQQRFRKYLRINHCSKWRHHHFLLSRQQPEKLRKCGCCRILPVGTIHHPTSPPTADTSAVNTLRFHWTHISHFYNPFFFIHTMYSAISLAQHRQQPSCVRTFLPKKRECFLLPPPWLLPNQFFRNGRNHEWTTLEKRGILG